MNVPTNRESKDSAVTRQAGRNPLPADDSTNLPNARESVNRYSVPIKKYADLAELERDDEQDELLEQSLVRRRVIVAWRRGHRWLQAKAILGHGDWNPWLARRGIAERTARRYMRLARELQNGQIGRFETVADAERALAAAPEAGEIDVKALLAEHDAIEEQHRETVRGMRLHAMGMLETCARWRAGLDEIEEQLDELAPDELEEFHKMCREEREARREATELLDLA